MIFAREINDPLTSLVKKLDAEVAKTNKKSVAFVVLLSDDPAAEKKLQSLTEKEGIKHVSLAVMEDGAGPGAFKTKIAKDADVTAVLYKSKKVTANHAFKKGGLNDKGVDQIIADFPK
jgi:hypothetical protein